MFYCPFFLSHLRLSSQRSTVWSLPTSACLPRVALTCWLAAVIRHMVGRSIDRSPPRTDKSRLVGVFHPLFIRTEAEQLRRRRGPPRPLDDASGKQIEYTHWCTVRLQSFSFFFFYPVDINAFKIIHSYTLLTSSWFSNNKIITLLYSSVNGKYI